MPRPNFGKLKAVSERDKGSKIASPSVKKQVTISRFFSPQANRAAPSAPSSTKQDRDDDSVDLVEVVEDEPVPVKEKQSSPVKAVKV